MKPLPSSRSIVPILYVGRDLTPDGRELLLARRIGVTVAETAARARRLLAHFRVAAVVFATPDLQGLAGVIGLGTPIVVLAGREATCDLDAVTIVRRDMGLEDLAAVIHGVVSARLSPQAARDAA